MCVCALASAMLEFAMSTENKDVPGTVDRIVKRGRGLGSRYKRLFTLRSYRTDTYGRGAIAGYMRAIFGDPVRSRAISCRYM